MELYVRHQHVEGTPPFGTKTPGPRYQTGIASIPVGDGLFPDGAVSLFAGDKAPSSTKQSSSNDVWVYPVAGWGWKRLSNSHCSREYTGILLEVSEAANATIDSGDDELLLMATHRIGTLPASATIVAASALFLSILAVFLRHKALCRGEEDKSEDSRCYHSLSQ